MSKPHGSTLLRKKKGKSGKMNFNGKLNLMNVAPKESCLDGGTYCGGNTGQNENIIYDDGSYGYGGGAYGGGALPPKGGGATIEPDPTPPIYYPQTPVEVIEQPAPQPEPQPVVYNPPYTYSQTDNASCAELEMMISSTRQTMMQSKMPIAQLEVYQNRMAHAEDRYNAGCKVIEPQKPIEPIEVVPTPPVYHVPETPVEITPDNPPVLPSNPNLPVEPVESAPTVDNPVVTAPVILPYPISTGSGGSGAGDGQTMPEPEEEVKLLDWFWIIFTITAATSYFLTSGKPQNG